MNKDDCGPLVTSSQTLLLDYAVEIEGLLNKENVNHAEKKALENNSLYNEILLNILVFGPGKFIKKYHYDSPCTDLLIKNGILEIIDDIEVDNKKFEIIRRAYELAFNAYRQLDNNHFTAPIISYEEIFVEKKTYPSYKERQKIEKWLDDIKYCKEIFEKYITPTVYSLEELFGHYFNQNIHVYQYLFNDMFGKLGNKKMKKSFPFDIYDIYSNMGLKSISAEEFEYLGNHPLSTPGISFYPNNLNNLWLTPDNSTFLKHFDKSVDIILKDDEKIYFFI